MAGPKALTRPITRKQARSYDHTVPNARGVTALMELNGPGSYERRYKQTRRLLDRERGGMHKAKANRPKRKRKLTKRERAEISRKNLRKARAAKRRKATARRAAPSKRKTAKRAPARRKTTRHKATRRTYGGRYKALKARIGPRSRWTFMHRTKKGGVRHIPEYAVLGYKSPRALIRQSMTDKGARRYVARKERLDARREREAERAAARIRAGKGLFTPNRADEVLSYEEWEDMMRPNRKRRRKASKKGRRRQTKKQRAASLRNLRKARAARRGKKVTKRRRKKAGVSTRRRRAVVATTKRRRRKGTRRRRKLTKAQRAAISRRNLKKARAARRRGGATKRRRKGRKARKLTGRKLVVYVANRRRRRRYRRNNNNETKVTQAAANRRRRRARRNQGAYNVNRRRRYYTNQGAYNVNRRRRRYRRNQATMSGDYMSQLKSAMKLGLSVLVGYAGHRATTHLLDEMVLSKVAALNTGALAPYRGLIASAITAAIGIPVAVKVAPKLAVPVAAGMAASLLQGALLAGLVAANQQKIASYLSAYPDAAGRMYGQQLGSYYTFRPHEIFPTSGYGSYYTLPTPTAGFGLDTSQLTQAAAGFGQPRLFEAAAGYGQDPNMLTQAAAGMGALVTQAAAGTGEYIAYNASAIGDYDEIPTTTSPMMVDEGIYPNLGDAEQALSVAEAAAGVGSAELPLQSTVDPSLIADPVTELPGGSRSGVFQGGDGIFGG